MLFQASTVGSKNGDPDPICGPTQRLMLSLELRPAGIQIENRKAARDWRRADGEAKKQGRSGKQRARERHIGPPIEGGLELGRK